MKQSEEGSKGRFASALTFQAARLIPVSEGLLFIVAELHFHDFTSSSKFRQAGNDDLWNH